MVDQLLVLTKRQSYSVADLLKRPELAQFPFEAGTSRLKHKPDLFKFELRSEYVPDLVGKAPKTWEECCAQRAEHLLKLDKEKYFVMYSGGIDSTGLMTSLIKFWPPQALKRVFVVLTETSICENPHFFDQFISKFELVHAQKQNPSKLVGDHSVLLTGELGDQLFGSDILAEACDIFGEESLMGDYREFAPKLIEKRGRRPGCGQAIFENTVPIVEECPFPIRTLHDFFWWFNFTQKWQHVKFRFAELRDWDLSKRYGSHVLHFFDSADFQVWSLNNHDLKIQKSWQSYKFAAKEFIHSLTKTREDLSLQKVQSLKRMYLFSQKRVAVTNDYKEILNKEELRPYVRAGY